MSARKKSTIELNLLGYRLATAEILYWMPDHPTLLQSFVWQQYDQVPDYPELHRFLGFWKENIDATLHSVSVACADLLQPGRVRRADVVLDLN